MLTYPSVFDSQIRSMEGEQFHVSLTDDIKPFCVNYTSIHTIRIQR